MRIPNLLGYAIGAAAAISLLAGCSGGSQTAPTSVAQLPGLTQSATHGSPVGYQSRTAVPSILMPKIFQQIKPGQPATGPSWIKPNARPAMWLYGSSYYCNCVNIYDAKGKNQAPIGQLTGLVNPQSMSSDRQGRLWVANTGASNVLVYPRGATTPSITLADPGEYPVDVVRDYNGNVYVANIFTTSGTAGSVSVYGAGSPVPTSTLTDPSFNQLIAITVDASHNVFVSYNNTSGVGQVMEFPKATMPGINTGITLGFAGGMTFDNAGNLLVNDQLAPATQVYTGSGSTWTLSRSFGTTGDPLGIAFGHEEHNVFVANVVDVAIDEYTYSSGAQNNKITNPWTSSVPPFGVAVIYPSPY